MKREAILINFKEESNKESPASPEMSGNLLKNANFITRRVLFKRTRQNLSLDLRQRVFNQGSLAQAQFFRQRIGREPVVLFNLYAVDGKLTGGTADIQYLKLRKIPDGSDEPKLERFNLKGDLFTNLSSQADFRLLAFGEKSSRYAPPAIASKPVFEQENATRFVQDYRRDGYCEMRLQEIGRAIEQRGRQDTIQSLERFS